MVYTDIIRISDTTIFITDKDGIQKVYYTGKSVFDKHKGKAKFDQPLEIHDFKENYGEIIKAKACNGNSVIKTTKGVYVSGNIVNQYTRKLVEIIDFYKLYGNLYDFYIETCIIYFATDKGLFYHGYPVNYFQIQNSKNISPIPNFINIFGIPTYIGGSYGTSPIIKTNKGLYLFNNQCITLLNENMLILFENTYGLINKVCSYKHNNEFKILLITDNNVFDIGDLVFLNDIKTSFISKPPCPFLSGSYQCISDGYYCIFYNKYEFYCVGWGLPLHIFDVDIESTPDLLFLENIVDKYNSITSITNNDNFYFIVTIYDIYVVDYYKFLYEDPKINFKLSNFCQTYGNISLIPNTPH